MYVRETESAFSEPGGRQEFNQFGWKMSNVETLLVEKALIRDGLVAEAGKYL